MSLLKRALRAALVRSGAYPHAMLLALPFKKIEFDVLTRRAGLSRDDTVLDFGCGGGFITVLLARQAGRVTGLDILPSSIAVARRDAAGRSNVTFEARSLEAAAFPADTFDKVFSFSVLEHIPGYRHVLSELQRVLKPGGMLLFSCDALQTIDDPEIRRKHRTDHAVHQYFEPDEIRSALIAAGFVDVTVEPLFQSDFARARFIEGIEKRFAFGIARAAILYRQLRSREEARHDGKGLFLIVTGRKPASGAIA